MKIAALMVVKNEWPLLAVSISHALNHHCDEIYVIDNNSSDNTRSGVEYLNSRVWPGRIHYYYYSNKFDQAAITSYGMRLASQGGAEFIVALDADEFLITKQHPNLEAYITSREKDHDFKAHSSIRVIAQNFAVNFNFDLNNLDDYSNLKTQTIPNQENVYKSAVELTKLIATGEVNYFDNHPWNFKCIPRVDNRFFITFGNHDLIPKSQVALTFPEVICIAHIPFSSIKKITSLLSLQSGGVQLSVAKEFEKLQSLEAFWGAITVPADGTEPGFTYEKVPWFADSLEPVIGILGDHWNTLLSPPPSNVKANQFSETEFHAGVLACRAAIDYIEAHS